MLFLILINLVVEQEKDSFLVIKFGERKKKCSSTNEPLDLGKNARTCRFVKSYERPFFSAANSYMAKVYIDGSLTGFE